MAGFSGFLSMLSRLARDVASLLRSFLRSRTALAAENLFLRKQLAFYKERKVKPRRADEAAKLVLVLLSRCFDWKEALVVVRPATLIRWHRLGFRLLWRWKVRGGRPRIPGNLRELIQTMARDNPSWGEERIASELSVKLGIRVSGRTVRKYMPRDWRGRPKRDVSADRWGTFVRNHARAIAA